MAADYEEFLRQLLPTFKDESAEQLEKISSGLIELEKETQAEKRAEIIEVIARQAHSLKGSSASIGLEVMTAICQVFETVVLALKDQPERGTPDLFDLLHETTDVLHDLRKFAGKEVEDATEERADGVIDQLKKAAGDTSQKKPEKKHRKTPSPAAASERRGPGVPEIETETIRISTAQLDSLLFQAEELVAAKLAANQRAVEARETAEALAVWKQEYQKAWPDIREIEQLTIGKSKEIQEKARVRLKRIAEFLNWENQFNKQLEEQIENAAKTTERDKHVLDGMVDSLLNDMKNSLTQPVSSLIGAFPRVVRDLARKENKDIAIEITGGEIEIDRRILEEMKDALTHIVRNCVDHGIETPDVREKKGKPKQGKITVSVQQIEGGRVEIVVADDGAGINTDSLRVAAVKEGVLTDEAAKKMSDTDILQSLIFESGVSTSPALTEVSGRGLGMAIVREKIDKLSGMLSTDTARDAGTTFKITLPITLATFRGILVEASDRHFFIPTSNVYRVITVDEDGIKTVENRETIQLNKRVISLVRMAEALVLKPASNSESTVDGDRLKYAVILGSAEKSIAFLVDKVIREEEVLVKSLGKQLTGLPNISGATVIGNGEVIPILNTPNLLKMASGITTEFKPRAKPVEINKTVAANKQSVLLVEDSITTRALLKNILESVGYDVTTAVDGADALATLKNKEFDIVVSDVIMPRMDGFDLTSSIKADKKTRNLPVILVSAAESREDLERGVEVGANTYLVKSSFDQKGLLEAIRKLI